MEDPWGFPIVSASAAPPSPHPLEAKVHALEAELRQWQSRDLPIRAMSPHAHAHAHESIAAPSNPDVTVLVLLVAIAMLMILVLTAYTMGKNAAYSAIMAMYAAGDSRLRSGNENGT
jgi:hypothetical protein